MYSRYKIQTPAPPPDYAGTAFKTDSTSQANQALPPENQTPPELSVNMQENQAESIRERPPEARWEVPPDIFPDNLPDEQLIPDSPLTPEASLEEEHPSISESEPDSKPDSEPGPEPEQSDSPADEESAGSLLAGMNPDDLLFIGAMLYLLSGKTGNDSFLLLAYLLTCGL